VRSRQRADVAETDKRSDWRGCLNHHRDFSTGEGAVFVAFGVEIAGGLGKEVRAFYMHSASSGSTGTTTSTRATGSQCPSGTIGTCDSVCC
jgi:hypothetical protein